MMTLIGGLDLSVRRTGLPRHGIYHANSNAIILHSSGGAKWNEVYLYNTNIVAMIIRKGNKDA